jgi:hypothetical protein
MRESGEQAAESSRLTHARTPSATGRRESSLVPLSDAGHFGDEVKSVRRV